MAGLTFIDELLQDQRELTAVDQFARWHESISVPASPSRYERLLPAAPPGQGEQYAFEVDLDRCSGCKACVTACHALNGLEDDESWRSVGLLVSPGTDATQMEFAPIQQHITTACHHCVDPACMHGCPVLAYDKDPMTGVVRHLDDQCMGCSYCVMKCPYEVPRFSKRLGIVRKCDMCSHRLAAGEAPACAQACPSEAIRITVVRQRSIETQYRKPRPAPSEIESDEANLFLPDSPPPSLTLPATQFVSRRVLPEEVKSADREALRLDSAHGSLVAMLILSQAAAGVFAASAAAELTGLRIHFPWFNTFAATLLFAGLIASVTHLGRPGKAWRSFLGWRRSWLSREIIAFGAFALVGGIASVAAFVPAGLPWRRSVTCAAASFGMIAVFVSSMVYVDTGRRAWRFGRTLGNFFGTTLLLGSTLAAGIFAAATGGENEAQAGIAQVAAAATAMVIRTLLFMWRRLELSRALSDPLNSFHWNARVVAELLPGSLRWRNLLFVFSTGAGLLAVVGLGGHMLVWASLAAASTTASELIDRYVYFVAGGTKRMPGVWVS